MWKLFRARSVDTRVAAPSGEIAERTDDGQDQEPEAQDVVEDFLADQVAKHIASLRLQRWQ